MKSSLEDVRSLVDLLRSRADETADRTAFVFLRDRGRHEEKLSYRELDLKARIIGGHLQRLGSPGDCVILLYPPGLPYITAFLGCLYAGRVAVPLYPPRDGQKHFRAARVIEDSGAQLALTSRDSVPALERFLAASPALSDLELIASDALGEEAADAWQPPEIGESTLAFLQYTSGSTATPKGVMISHGNLMANQKAIAEGFGTRPEDVCVSWLPLYHDMGLIGTVLHALYQGFVSILMPSVDFIRRPMGWLEAIDHYRATVCGAPNFAYELLLRAASTKGVDHLDLSSWRVAFNGAEPVRASTLERFAETFSAVGFRREAFYPCYGLAESTLFVSGGVAEEAPVVRQLDPKGLEEDQVKEADAGSEKAQSLVGSGKAASGCRLEIVDPSTCERVESGRVGEIWVSGPSVARGYWNRPEESARTFGAATASGSEETFLRTGDLGFVTDGELFVTGRLKDLLILRGRNHYPQDIEATVESCHPALQAAGGAAFSVEVDGQEELVVLQEVSRRHRRTDPGEVIDAIRAAIAQVHELRAHAVVVLAPGGLLKTSSGKVRRSSCREAFLAGRLRELARSEDAPGGDEALAASGEGALATSGDGEGPGLGYLRQIVAEVLGVRPETIRPERPLIALGVDSLMSVELEHRLESEHGRSLSIDRILGGASLEELATALETPPKSARSDLPGSAAEQLAFPLSHGQRALWFLHRLAPEQTAYHVVAGARVRSPLDVGALRRAVDALAKRHPVLRATFHAPDGEPLQRIRETPPELHTEDVSSLEGAALREHMERWAYRPFDLEAGPLLRLAVFARQERDPVLVLSLHHLVVDFWSLAILAEELGALYSRESLGLPADEAPSGPAYADYVAWQQERLAGAEGEILWSYWSEQLAGARQQLDLPCDRPRSAQQSFRGASRSLRLRADLTRELHALAERHEATPYMALFAAFAALLGRLSGQRDLLVGSPSSGRGAAQFAALVGYFVNPLVLRADLSGNPGFGELLERARQTVLDAFAYQEYPFALLAQKLRPERDTSRSPLFQVMFSWQQTPRGADPSLAAFALGQDGARTELGGLALESIALRDPSSQLDLTLKMAQLGDALTASMQYDLELFDATTVERFLASFESLLTAIAADPRRSVAELPLLGAAERHELLLEWNDTVTEPLPEPTIPRLFERQARRRSEAIAVSFAGERLTYGELDARSDRFARELLRCGVGPESLVGLCVERSAEMVVALLGILKSGGAYVPLDPAYPKERLAFMMADAELAVLVAGVEQRRTLWPHAARLKVLDIAAAGEPADRERGEKVGVAVSGENLAYVIYTSGSTGRPKGVEIRHRSAVSFLLSMARAPGLTEEDVLLAVTTLSFDIAGLELYLPLLMGAELVVASREDAADGARLSRRLEEHEVTAMQATPATWRLLGASGWQGNRGLKILCGGEALPPPLAAELLAHGGPVWNLYGPTETTIWSAVKRVRHDGAQTPSSELIGGPIANTRIHLLEPSGEAAPIGVAGELLIGGIGLARGYRGRPALCAEKFVPDPMGEEEGGRLYRTGDLARYRPGGAIEFLGRIDHQVKVRGFRIELGEIEAALGAHPGLAAAVVVAREESAGDRRLVAYVVPRPERRPTAGELRDLVREQLPEYMVPAAVVVLDEMPLTPSGKVDRKTLPAPRWGSEKAELALPRTPQEELLAGIWAEVLGVERVGIHDNFFENGGHSLLATLLISRIQNVFGVELPVKTVFASPSVAALMEELAPAIESGSAHSLPPLEPAPRVTDLQLSFAQERLWFLHQLEPESAFYNLPSALRLEGRLQARPLAEAFREVVRRHESLRTSFRSVSGQPVQVIAPEITLEIPLVDLSLLDHERREARLRELMQHEVRQPFDLSRGPLLRIFLFRTAPEEHVILVTVHHIACDGWSMDVFIQEIASLYGVFSAGEASPLQELPVQYADFAAWQRGWLRGEVLDRELAYWRERLSGAPPLLELPTDRPRPSVQTYHGAKRSVRLSPTLASSLSELSRRQGATIYMTVLAAFQTLLHRYAAQNDIVVSSPIANRNRLEIENLIGFFANSLVLRSDFSENPTFPELLEQVRETTLGAYAHQDLPFERLVQELQPERDLAHTPIFQVVLIFQEVAGPSLGLPGLDWSPLEVETGTAQFDVVLTLTRTKTDLEGSITYNTDLFDASTAGRMWRNFKTLLEEIAADPERRVLALPLLGPGQHQQMLTEWNDTRKAFPPADSIHRLFEDRVASAGEKTALIHKHDWLTYREVNRRANRLAHYLRSLGVGPEVRVGLLVERGLRMVLGALGILKAGGAYVPLDPAYPHDRIAFMLEDAEVPVLVTQERLASISEGYSGKIVDVDLEPPSLPGCEENPRSGVAAKNLAYVLYTSGSTGRPKGVALLHGNAVNLIHWAREVFDQEDLDGMAATTSICFDVSVFEMFSPLGWGGKIVIAGDPIQLKTEPAVECARMVSTAPPATDALHRLGLPRSLRKFFLGGEAVPIRLIQKLYEEETVAAVLDGYGPSEDTTYTTSGVVARDWHKAPPIGRPASNKEIYLLNQRLEPVPVSVAGALCIGGAGQARGYLKRPGLTAEKFIPSPMGEEPGYRLYHTGDLARFLTDGRIDFLGRMDHQVKVRGFRIEIGEVETNLARHPKVQKVAVMVRANAAGDKQLVAYVLALPGEAPTTDEMRQFLRKNLPDYMLPSVFVEMSEFPLTPSGKVDRKSLPDPDEARPELLTEYTAPRTEVERTIAEIWTEALGRDHLGIHDNFFDLGGHSLLLLQVRKELEHRFHREISLTEMFKFTTISFTAEHLADPSQERRSFKKSFERADRKRRAMGRKKGHAKRKR